MEDDKWDIISVYTRAQAIEDGTLIDVSELAKEAGFRYPVAVTSGVWADWITPPADAVGQDEKGRLWDLLNILRFEIRKSKGGDRVDFKVLFQQADGKKYLPSFYALVHGGDDLRPVITVMLEGED